MPNRIQILPAEKDSPIYIHTNTLIGLMARWAVQQHPYHAPPNLFKICKEFAAYMEWASDHKVLAVLRFDTTKMFRQRIFEFCNLHKLTRRWNVPRSKHKKNILVSAYHKNPKRHDFIDLDALAMNIASSAIQESSK